ncbi:N-acetyl-alpha-D-glucosaminyl L-malate synthase BshA [Candidatus Sumerlaeota bacterium]|nr:N-acetyl-alpha-D-glucosaminyl L-malate synthase BshA [Candidatus Sumerlaeota bacterium]
MRIGIVCYPTYGGSGALATDLGTHLAARGHCVHIISYEMPFRLTRGMGDRVFFHEVPMTDYPVMTHPYYSLNLAVKIGQVTEEADLDILHVHYAVPHAVSAHLAQEMLAPRSLPIVTTLHGTDITLVGTAPAYQPIVRFSIDQSDAVTAVSHWLRDQTIEHFAPQREIRVIHNFIDTERFQPRRADGEARRRLARDDERIVMHISNFRPVKRLVDVMEIFVRIARQMPSRLILIGDGPDREVAATVARCNGIADRVVFLGKQSEIESLLPLADLFLFPSDHESFGLAPAEAMACEVPVVASDSGGLPEVIDHRETGFLAPVGAVEEMAEMALRVLGDADLAQRMGRAARRAIHGRFSPEMILPHYLDLYREIITAAGRVFEEKCEVSSH